MIDQEYFSEMKTKTSQESGKLGTEAAVVNKAMHSAMHIKTY